MKIVHQVLAAVDAWQRRHTVVAVAFAVNKKFGNDNLGLLVVSLGWYGFLSIYPLLLVVTTVLGYVGAASLGTSVVSTLHQFPVIGSQFNPEHASSSLHGNAVGLVVGLLGLLYGAQGVTQTAQQAMATAWSVPMYDRPGFMARLGRSLASLAIIGGAFVANAAAAAFATGHGESLPLRVGLIAALVALNFGLYFAAFRSLAPKTVGTRSLWPGSLLGAVGFTLLITIGSGLIQHQVRNSSATYGQFGVVIGLVGFLLLLAKLSLYAAELNPVLERRWWPRSLVSSQPTEADRQVLHAIAEEMGPRPEPAGVAAGPAGEPGSGGEDDR